MSRILFLSAMFLLSGAVGYIYLVRDPVPAATTLYLNTPQHSMKDLVVQVPSDVYDEAAATAVNIEGKQQQKVSQEMPAFSKTPALLKHTEGSAETIVPDEPEDVPPPPRRIQISSADCRRLIQEQNTVPADYQPGISTTGQVVASADYQPGISASGQAVAGADWNGGYDFPLPDLNTVTLPLSLDLEKNFPFWSSDLFFGSIPIATIVVKDGKIYANGHSLSQDAVAVLQNACKSVSIQ